MVKISKANIYNSAHVQNTLKSSQELPLNLLFVKKYFIQVKQYTATYTVRLSYSTSALFWFCTFLHLEEHVTPTVKAVRFKTQ